MSHRSKHSHEDENSSHLSILEAVENLSNIADMDINDKIGLLEDHVIVHGASEDDTLEAIQWLEDKSEHQTEKVVEETYKAVLKYVKDFHKKEFTRFYDQKNQEGIKKIMLLVGKASDKLNSYTHLFKGVHLKGIEETQEYRQLNKFYNERIAIDEGEKISLIDLSRHERKLDVRKQPQIEEDENTLKSKQFFLDVEKTKKDESYEFLFLQKEDGSRFLEPNFYRNIKVACNFGEFVGKHIEQDPLAGLNHWQDLSLHKSAIHILQKIRPFLKNFYAEALKYKDMDIVASVNMAIMSLMLAANPKNRSHLNPAKGCGKYYQDFQHFLRNALTSFEYSKMRDFPPPNSSLFLHTLLNIINLLSWSFFHQSADLNSLSFVLDDLIEEGRVAVQKHQNKKPTKMDFFQQLKEDYIYIQRFLMNYPVGPLFKTLSELIEGQEDSFDSYSTGNLPSEFQRVKWKDQEISILRLPSPTTQEMINKVQVAHEFSGLIDAFSGTQDKKKHLLVNLQDRTSWREVARATFLEKLPQDSHYANYLDTVTLSTSSDFYYQIGAYEGVSQAKEFVKQIIFHLKSEETGYYFPKWMQENLFKGFIESLIGKIHRFFFLGKATLSKEEREVFIEILYQFLILKTLELSKGTSLSFTCKDGLDSGSAQTMMFYTFLRLISGGELGARDHQKMHLMLFAYPLIFRNRQVQSKDFLRTVQTLDYLESSLKKHAKNEFEKVFSPLYEGGLGQIDFIKPSLEVKVSEDS